MKSFGTPLAISQKDAIGDAVERLAVLQGKHLTGAAKNLFAEELSLGQYPFEAIMAGLRSLEGEEIDRIAMPGLRKAIKRHLEPETENRASCVNCGRFGVVLMEDPLGRVHSLACSCENGDAFQQAQGLVRWNGLESQVSSRRDKTGRIETRTLTLRPGSFPSEK